MRSFITQTIFLGWALFLLQGATPVAAQEYLVNVRTFTTADGLSNDQVQSLLQDRDGFIWIGTKYDLNRFDGHSFQVFTKESHGLQSSIINQLLEGPDGRIWVIRYQEGYGLYDYYSIDLLEPAREVVTPWEQAFPDLPFSLEEVERIHGVPGGILLQVEEHGYYLLKDNSFEPTPFPADFQFISAPEEGHFVGRLADRYVTLDLSGQVVRFFRLADNLAVGRLEADYEGNYWCLVGGRSERHNTSIISKLIKVDPSGQYTEEDQVNMAQAYVLYASFRNRRALLYIQSGEIREYDLEADRVLVNSQALQNRSIIWPAVALTDQRNALWIGDYNGLRVFDLNLSRFTTFLQDQDEPVSARGMTIKGPELVYTGSGEPRVLDLRTGRTTAVIEEGNPIMLRPSPFSVLRTEDDQLVLGGKEMFRVGEQYRLTNVSDLKAQLGPGRIWSFGRGQDGQYWVGYGEKYTVILDPDFATYRLVPDNGYEDFASTVKYHFFVDGEYCWIAAQNGLFLVHQQRGVIAQFGANADEAHYLPAIIFHFTYKDSQGNYWLATGDGGLIKLTYDPEEPGSLAYHQYKLQDGLPSMELYAIMEDERGVCWISTANGLVQFDPETEGILVYYEDQGIAHNEFNRLSYYQHTDG
ncbi:MAG: hypothetical protein KDC54_24935, partial [Lewinella sp.]|nr:hypothetical protein [Lewinella sp.]